MAQSFVGANNINLLLPIGQFGTRNQGGKDHASARYIFTSLSKITRYNFFKLIKGAFFQKMMITVQNIQKMMDNLLNLFVITPFYLCLQSMVPKEQDQVGPPRFQITTRDKLLISLRNYLMKRISKKSILFTKDFRELLQNKVEITKLKEIMNYKVICCKLLNYQWGGGPKITKNFQRR